MWNRTLRGLRPWLPALLLLGTACDQDEATPAVDPKVVYEDGCDPIVPTVCGFPFPSDIWLVDDATKPSGHRVEMPDAVVPQSSGGNWTQLAYLRRNDGFSPGTALITHLPGATATGLANPLHIGDSLAATSPTVLIDTVTGERVPHWAEIDVRSNEMPGASDTPTVQRAFLIQPAVRLEDGRRYIVAIRHVVDVDGVEIPPSDGFRALRDGTASGVRAIEVRRAKYRDILARLRSAGVDVADLQIAWDFSTSTQENQTGGMLAMRDQALAWLETQPGGSPPYEITKVTDNPDAHIARRIEGMITVPMYLDTTAPGGMMTIDEATGLPVQQGTAKFPFLFQIPNSVTAASPTLQFGHGLFGGYMNGTDSRLTPVADDFGMNLLSLDWLGLTGDDLGGLSNVLTSGDLSNFRTVPDRGQQAMLNNILALRMVTHGLINDPITQLGGAKTIDATQVFYWGASLGGIYGATYMALTPDIPRGVLGVPGQSFDLLLPRSSHFDLFLGLVKTQYPDDVVRVPLVLSLAQMFWDRVDPTGYSRHVTHDPLPNTQAHQVFMIDALGDHQVTTLGAHVMARAIGVSTVGSEVRSIYGVPNVPSPYSGSGFIEIDFGRAPEPVTNVPALDGGDTHDMPWTVPTVIDMMHHFALTGEIENLCTGTCTFP